MHAITYLAETTTIAQNLDPFEIEALATELHKVSGKIYIIGLGGSMANALHMAADFCKLCELNAEAFCNIAEITARANDEGFVTIFNGWLKRMTDKDALFVLSVGGGTDKVSIAIKECVLYAKIVGAKVFGIVGPNGGITAQHGDVVIKIPTPMDRITPHTEAFQMVISHALVCHPLLQKKAMVW